MSFEPEERNLIDSRAPKDQIALDQIVSFGQLVQQSMVVPDRSPHADLPTRCNESRPQRGHVGAVPVKISRHCTKHRDEQTPTPHPRTLPRARRGSDLALATLS